MKITSHKSKSKWSRFGIMLFVLGAFAFGVFLGQQGIFAAVIARLSTNLNQTASEETAVSQQINVDINFQNYSQILNQRNEALAQGVYLANDADFMPATITIDGVQLLTQMRLQPGATAQTVDGERWPFEFVVENSPEKQLRHFYLIVAENHEHLMEKGYQESLAQAGILSTTYALTTLILNGDDLGTYAIQEHPQSFSFLTAEQPAGVVVNFNPEVIWQNIAYTNGNATSAIAEPVPNIERVGWQLMEVNAVSYNQATVPPEIPLKEQEKEAIQLLQAFQQNSLPATAVFDVEKYGMFLALSDLWGAADATDLKNLYFYFNPTTGLLEPIGFNGNPQIENGRINIQNVTFNDLALQQAYINALQIVLEPTYLETVQASWEEQHVPAEQQEAVLDRLARQQLAIQRSLHPQQPVLAYYQIDKDGANAAIHLDVHNLTNLPVELVGIDNNAQQFIELQPEWLITSLANDNIILPPFDGQTDLIQLTIPLTVLHNDAFASTNLQLGTRVLGTEFITYVPIHPRLTPANPTENNNE